MTRQRVEDWLTGINLVRLRDWVRHGITDAQLCANMGIGKTTLYKWKNECAEFANILKEDKDYVDAQVENALVKKALSGDTTAIIFWLKNRRPRDFRDKVEVDTNIESLNKARELLGGVDSVID